MDHIAYCHQIGFSEQAISCIQNSPITENEYIHLRDLFNRDVQSFCSNVCSYPDFRQRFLYLYTRLGSEVVEDYRRNGISETICWDTLSDQKIWYENCIRDYCEPGLAEYDWLWWPLKKLLFRLGRLQFAPIPLPDSINSDAITLPVGSLVLNTHIPQGCPLEIESVKDSFRQALTFFRGIYPVFYCHSWLLSPELKRVLAPDSNIMKFQNLFTILKTDENDPEAIIRIFNRSDNVIEQYPEETTLQKNAKRHLLEGGKIGIGIGIFIAKDTLLNS